LIETIESFDPYRTTVEAALHHRAASTFLWPAKQLAPMLHGRGPTPGRHLGLFTPIPGIFDAFTDSLTL